MTVSIARMAATASIVALMQAPWSLVGQLGISVRHVDPMSWVVDTYEGTGDIHGLIMGHAITGIQAFN